MDPLTSRSTWPPQVCVWFGENHELPRTAVRRDQAATMDRVVKSILCFTCFMAMFWLGYLLMYFDQLRLRPPLESFVMNSGRY